MPRFIIGSSLKMYFGHRRTLDWVRAVAQICREHPATRDGLVEFFVIPTFPSIPGVLELAGPAGITVGAQDLFWADSGPFTGEVGGPELAEIGCRMVEVGHAERRAQFRETDEVVARKTAAALRNGLTPVLCIGEPERADRAPAIDFCVRQLTSALALARADGLSGRLVVAYEPIWAIGAPEPAGPTHVRAVCGALREHLSGDPDFPDATVIYGGSAGPGLLARIADDVDGMFLGRFAHDPAAVRVILDEALAVSPASPAGAPG